MGDTENVILQALGRMEGKMDLVISAAEEHRKDDIRRFTELHVKVDEHKVEVNKKFDEQAADINKAKGARGVIVWLIGGGLASIAASAVALMKTFGK